MTAMERLEDAVERLVRPELAEHGGDIEIVGYEDGVAKVRLLGRCSGCPSAQLTTEELISAKLKEELPELRDVVLVTGVSRETLDMALNILRGRGK